MRLHQRKVRGQVSPSLGLQDNYGRGNLEAVQRVKKLYHELELEPLFKQYEADSHEKLVKMIHEQEILPPAVFTMLLNKIYKRTK